MAKVESKGLFPTPLLRVREFLSDELISACIAHVEAQALETNSRSAALSHTDIVEPDAQPHYQALMNAAMPHVKAFGHMLFGEMLEWQVKEIWTNVLETGGFQGIHTHANSFISGVVYLTPCHPSANTVFHRDIGGREFIFSNQNEHAATTQFNGSKWVSPDPQPGDMVLFPSYLLHDVPVNEGPRRMTVAFNALPDRLDSYGYRVEFNSRRL